MVHGLVRSPSFYFDITPSGRFVNNFSNDLGIMDYMLPFVLIDALEGPILYIVLLINVFIINRYFVLPGILCIIFVIWYYMYCKEAMIKIKQLDLRLKSPVFNMVG